jgi:hypothetical protein
LTTINRQIMNSKVQEIVQSKILRSLATDFA